jgi:hypothetical protein
MQRVESFLRSRDSVEPSDSGNSGLRDRSNSNESVRTVVRKVDSNDDVVRDWMLADMAALRQTVTFEEVIHGENRDDNAVNEEQSNVE